MDVSATVQPYPPQEQQYLTGFILSDQCGPLEPPSVRDLMENDLVEQFVAQTGRLPEMGDLAQIAPRTTPLCGEEPMTASLCAMPADSS